MAANDGTVLIEGGRMVYRNFAGKETQYNREGDRNFGIVIPEALAQQMLEDGWNAKQFKPREDDEEGTELEWWLPVKLGFGKGRPPRVVVITERGRTNIGEAEVEMLDWADVKNVDLIVRPYSWSVRGENGISAYCQSLYVTIEEDPLERKYAELDAQ